MVQAGWRPVAAQKMIFCAYTTPPPHRRHTAEIGGRPGIYTATQPLIAVKVGFLIGYKRWPCFIVGEIATGSTIVVPEVPPMMPSVFRTDDWLTRELVSTRRSTTDSAISPIFQAHYEVGQRHTSLLSFDTESIHKVGIHACCSYTEADAWLRAIFGPEIWRGVSTNPPPKPDPARR
jgi:hypothetical protein